jgi:regulator of RNase E activity RraA
MTNVERIIKGFKKLPTSNVSDALDRLSIEGVMREIRPVTVEKPKVVGRAVTAKLVDSGRKNPNMKIGEYLLVAKQGDVIVIDSEGRTDCSAWGDLLSVACQIKGIQGTVIDGALRDVDAVKEVGYPIFALSCTPRSGKLRHGLESVNAPILCGRIQVKPGDLIVADGSGVVVIPWDRVEEVLKIAREIHAAEEIVRERVLKGMSIQEAHAKVGYSDLSRPKT